VRSTGRVAKRQEASPYALKWAQTIRFANRANVTFPNYSVAEDEASCRFATPPPCRDGGATRSAVARWTTRAPQMANVRQSTNCDIRSWVAFV